MTDIAEQARKGLPLKDILLIDCHCHMGYWSHFNVPCGLAGGMLASMDALGTDIACVTAHSSIGPDFIYGNDMVMAAVEKYPERFIGYATVNPNYPEDMKHELERCFAVKGIRGIKLHPACHGTSIDHKNYRIAYETAHAKGCPILIHIWGKSAVAVIDRLADTYSDALFIMGHGGADIDAMEAAVDVVGRHANVYVDLAISRVREGNVEWLVKEMGPKKILFGSDMPFFDPRPAFGRIAFADIGDSVKKDIFGLNMERLLKRSGEVNK